jgi:hypothetical protein
VRYPFWVADLLGDLEELVAQREAFGRGIGSVDRGGTAIEGVGERARVSDPAGELDCFTAVGIAPVSGRLIAERAG